jgi:hypothetical protein
MYQLKFGGNLIFTRKPLFLSVLRQDSAVHVDLILHHVSIIVIPLNRQRPFLSATLASRILGRLGVLSLIEIHSICEELSANLKVQYCFGMHR